MQTAQRRPQLRTARAQERILDAAEPLFAERGFHGTGVREVAEAAGMPTASLLHHYPNKERLYGAVLDRIATALLARLDEIVEPPRPISPRTRLARLAGLLCDWAERSPGHPRLLLRELLDNAARIGGAGRLPLAEPAIRIVRIVEEGQRERVFRAIDPLMALVHVVGSLSYFVAARPTLERLVPPARAAQLRNVYRRELASLVERLLLAPKEGAR